MHVQRWSILLEIVYSQFHLSRSLGAITATFTPPLPSSTFAFQPAEVLIFVDMAKAIANGLAFQERSTLTNETEILCSGQEDDGTVPPTYFLKVCKPPILA